jgi:hypothetical protein
MLVMLTVAVAALATGCGLANPIGPGAEATRGAGPGAVEVMLQWLEEHTLRCVGPENGHAGATWACTHDQAEGVQNPDERAVLRVDVTAAGEDLAGIDAAVDQSMDDDVDRDLAAGFLGDTIGLSPATGAAGPALEAWLLDSLETGGQATFGAISATLTPLGRITRLRLAFTEPSGTD